MPASSASQYNKQRPLNTEVLENLRLSSKMRVLGNYHITLAIEQGKLTLEPGDAIGVFAQNPPELVESLITTTGLKPDTMVSVNQQSLTLIKALEDECDLSIPSKKLLQQCALWSTDHMLSELAHDSKKMRDWLKQHQVMDLLSTLSGKIPRAQDLVDTLRPLQPRLYDVANLITPESDELELLVKRFDYQLGQTTHHGIASHYLCDLAPGDKVRIYPHRNSRFSLTESEKPVILVGYGTGLAPFRSYLQAREDRSNSNPCWLVMGEQQYEQDFLYQVEWQAWLANGVLSHLDPIFKDDRPSRVLSNPFSEHCSRLLQWLSKGAIFYFCGDKYVLGKCETNIQKAYAEAANFAPVEIENFWKSIAAAGRIKRNCY
jgi:sulfite reductase (NADPH) flavoprotein alpha-component